VKLITICHCVLDFEDNPPRFLEQHQSSLTILSVVGQVYLGLSASSVLVECMLSSTRLISNENRSSTEPGKLNGILLIHDNFELITMTTDLDQLC